MNISEARLAELEDRERLRELCATYCFLVDDGRHDELVDDCFTEDAACEFRAADGSIEPLAARGREELRAFFAKLVPALLREMNHTVQNHRISVFGDLASGECYFELTAIEQGSDDPMVGAGRYLDRYRRTQTGWRFERRDASIFYLVPLAEGWSRRRFPASLIR